MKTATKAKRPPLSYYIKAGMPALRLLARIEREADVMPGSLIGEAIEGVQCNCTSTITPAHAWAHWVASNYQHEDGGPYTREEEADLAARLAPLFA